MEHHENGAFHPDDPADQPHSSRLPEPLSDVTNPFVEHANENQPLLPPEQQTAFVQSPEDYVEPDARLNGAQTVSCRVCDNQIVYQNKSMQHVVRCPSCNEATPIRSAPTGKKFVRCPCNCLLICKVSSNRIACPRPNCGRIIILKPTVSGEPSIPAPHGTARISCFYCEEIFMYNTITNSVVKCPHCQKVSSIGVGYARSRSFIYFMAALAAFLTLLFIMIWTVGTFTSHAWVIIVYAILLVVMLFYCQRFAKFVRLKTSRILGPI